MYALSKESIDSAIFRALVCRHQRMAVNRQKQKEKKANMQAHDLDGFIKQLMVRYKNLPRAWKKGHGFNWSTAEGAGVLLCRS